MLFLCDSGRWLLLSCQAGVQGGIAVHGAEHIIRAETEGWSSFTVAPRNILQWYT